MEQVLAVLSTPEKRILAALAFLDGVSLPVPHLAAVTGLADAGPAVQVLLRRGLVQACSPRYRLAGTVGAAIGRAWDLTPWAERALDYFAGWAEG